MENGILMAILLVDQAYGDRRGSQPGSRGCGRRDGRGSLPELNILFAQWHSASCPRGGGVFSNPKEEEESQGDQVSNSPKPGKLRVGGSDSREPLDSINRKRQFRLRRRVCISPLSEEVLKALVQVLTVAVQAAGIAESPTDHDLCAVAKRFLDNRTRSRSAIVELT